MAATLPRVEPPDHPEREQSATEPITLGARAA